MVAAYATISVLKETLLRYTLLIAINDDGEADDRGEKLVRESSTQYLQISSEGGESQLRRMMQLALQLRMIDSPLKVAAHCGV